MRFGLIIGVVVAFIVSGLALGQGAAGGPVAKGPARKPAKAKLAPKKANGGAQPLQATVVSVSGRAEKLVLVAGKQIWKPLKVGEKLGEKTVIRTGFRSHVSLRFADRGEMTVDNATKMGISEFRKSRRTVRTRLGLKYGTVRASVDSSPGPNDWRIKTPVATLSVRGTSGFVGYFGDAGARCRGTSGRWHIRSGNKTGTVLPKELRSTSAAGGAHLARAINIIAQRRNMQLGDTFGGLSRPEKKNIVTNGSGRTLLGGVKRRILKRVLGGHPTRISSGSHSTRISSGSQEYVVDKVND